MLTELPFPKGLTGSSGNSKAVSPSKESAGRNGVGGEGTNNCKILRKEDIQGKTGLSGDIWG